jgi:4-hydroxybenzoate polyprenyltransferase
VVFCLLSSIVYILNDVVDIERDRLHPLKKNRPIASGEISPRRAIVFAGLLSVLVFIVVYLFFNNEFAVVACGYFALMLFYNFWLKHVVIMDLLVIASGFVLRAIAGVVILNTPEHPVPLTPWFICAVFFLALFIVVCKRRHEVSLLENENAHKHRKVLQSYSLPLLDQFVSITTTATILSYALYAVTGGNADSILHHSKWTILTLPFVVFGIFRYLYLVYQKAQGGSPESLFYNDIWIILCVGLWAISMIFCIVL